jgi:hypothetical protein
VQVMWNWARLVSASVFLAGVWITSVSGQQAAESQPAAEPQTQSNAGAQEPAVRPKPAGGGHYVEFRVAQIGAYGHSYAVYGSNGGKPQYADLHPMGGYVVMALGHVLPVPANTEWNSDVLKLPVSARYRRSLDAAQYRKLVAAVRHAKANKQPYWNAVTNNCNHFVGELAQAIGLRVPGQFQVSYAFVPALRALNENASGRTTTAPSTRSDGMPAQPRS